MNRYAQIDETGRCIGVSNLTGVIDETNMIPLQPEDDVLPGDVWDGAAWDRPDPVPIPEPEPTPDQQRIAQLEGEAALLALELVDTQIRLEQSEAEHAALLFELVDKGVL